MTHPLVLAARPWIGTRWRHRGRKPGQRLDCVGLLVCALQVVGRPVQDREVYGREPEDDDLRQVLIQHCGQPLPKSQAREGDIGLFVGDQYPLHVGLVTNFRRGLGLLHASNEPGVKKVVEHELTGQWARRLIEVYRVEGLG